MNKKMETANEKRAKCNPFLIGALTALVAPLVGSIYGWRQRSWALGFAPLGIVILANVWITISGIEHTNLLKYQYQFFAGFTTGLIAYIQKKGTS